MDQSNQKIKTWQKEIEEITSDVEDLLYSKYQAEELEKIIRTNPFVQQNIGTFWEHYKLNYTYFIVSKIWHQVDENPRSLSLINLLKDLSDNHTLVTKSWWVSQGKMLSSVTFEEKFENGDYLDVSWISNDIKNLQDATKPIKEIRHKRIAHKDSNEKFSYSIGGESVNKAMSTIEELVIKYQLLLTQSGYASLIPEPDDWQVAFTKEWIKDEH